jgi:hypothetical protein
MQIKSKTLEKSYFKNVEIFKFTTGQTARFNTLTHATKCFNGIGRDITDTEIGKKMINAIEQYTD